MNRDIPGVLAVRAINQYRRRDAIAYLGLRYYLEARCAKADRWVREIAKAQLLDSSTPLYHKVHHFKEIEEHGGIRHRNIYVPLPTEIMAETALLSACAEAGYVFSQPDHVFSYILTQGDEKRGVFKPYFEGYRRRHDAVVNVCRTERTHRVVYTDIRKFYPSIDNAVARKSWTSACDATGLAGEWRDVGSHLLCQYRAAQTGDDQGVITGPMFSHLIGNLVLRDIDSKMAAMLPGGYFRYVDDVILVGEGGKVRQA